MPLRMFAVGRIAVDAGDVLVEHHLGSRQARLAFAFLLAERKRAVSRDELAEVLWPNQLPRSWEPAVRGVVSKVRHFVEEAGLPGGETLTCAFGCYQLRLPPDTVVDLDLTDSALEAAERALGESDLDVACTQALVAHSLASQPFLPGEEGEWIDRRRAERRTQLLRALEILAEVWSQRGEVAQGVLAAEEAVALEPFRETTHRRLMQAHAAAGNRAEALRAYERCRRLLAEELGVDPSPETEAAYLELLGQEPTPPPAFAPGVTLGLPNPERLGKASQAPFVGREPELRLLRALWEQCRDGHRQIVLLKGEAGSGKTRLVVEFATVLPAGVTVLYGRCEKGMDAAYQPFAEALDHYVAACPPEHLRRLVERTGAALIRIVPELPRYLPQPLLPGLVEPNGDPRQLFRAVTSFLTSVASGGSLVLVLEDLQWAQPNDLLLLRHVARNLETAPAMVVATYRGEDAGPALCDLLAGLNRESAIHRLTLSGLDAPAVAALVRAVTGADTDEAGQALTRALCQETEGNAFLLTQLLRDLLDSTSDRRVPTVEALAAVGVPPAVREAIAACRTGLSEFTNRALDLASVVGEEFELSVLEEAGGLDEGALLNALDEASKAGLAFEVPGAVGRYRFAHALTRDAVLAALGSTRRARLEERLRRGGAGEAGGSRSNGRRFGQRRGQLWQVLGIVAGAVQETRARAGD
jgi:DNA-binding SARP family transcriptional activator